MTTDTANRIADVRARVATAADDLYRIDRDTLDAAGWIALIGAANDLCDAGLALARLLGDPPASDAARTA